MISGWKLLLVSLAYVGGLFMIAWWGDRTRFYPRNLRLRPLIYALGLTVYCSSWTFYGAVGTGVREGFDYLPIYLGPILLFLFAMPFFERLARISKRRNATSISDLLSARFGRSRAIAVTVTLIALTAAIPYIALQLKAISLSVQVLTGAGSLQSDGLHRDSTFLVALLLATFAALFGTRQVDATEHHPGMVLAIAAESIIKLIALLLVGAFALLALGNFDQVLNTAREFPVRIGHPMTFITQTLVSFTAIFCLPRQFQIGVVECADVADMRRARWWFCGYLVLISLVVVPIIAAALALDDAGVANVSPDSFVLWLPLAAGHNGLALLAYLGGFSAATGMVIVASVALATMLSNDLILPALLRLRLLSIERRGPSSTTILWLRRIAIVGILLGAYGFLHALPDVPSLASIGLLAFAAVAQFAPALIACVYWTGASRFGVISGLIAGSLVWMYTLLLPAVMGSDGYAPSWLLEGPFGIGVLAPQSLLGMQGPDALTHGVFWSLFANALALVVVSLRHPPSIGERLEAANEFMSEAFSAARAGKFLPGSATVGDLAMIAKRLLGEAATEKLLERYAKVQGGSVDPGSRADVRLLQALERELSGALGASSARMVLTNVLRGAGLKLAEIVAVFDEASERLRINREVLEAMMDHMPQGISVVNAQMQLVAWNQQYLDLFEYPPGLVQIGRPVADLIRFNALRGWCGPGDPQQHVDRRLHYMVAGSPHVSERRRADGRVIEVRGQPLPDGGFVSTFTDITNHKLTQDKLREVNETLEQRVAERTLQLARASAAAEQANLSKTRFVAAASHDLLQPLNAARLFNAAIHDHAQQDIELRRLAERVDNSLSSAEELLGALLEISRLDAGGIRPDMTDFPIDPLLRSLQEQFAPLAAQRGIRLRVRSGSLCVHSDQRMLRRILQNFISNALRYTGSGEILIGMRRREGGARVELQVIDTGPGIPPESQRAIFDEFSRLDAPSPWGEKGLGLGLSIVDRLSRLLGAQVMLRSVLGRGSAFSIVVPRALVSDVAGEALEAGVTRLNAPVQSSVRVLCIEDDPNIQEALRELLGRWHIGVVTVGTPAQAEAALAEQRFDVILADYHLHGEPLGLELLTRLMEQAEPGTMRGALLTANASDALAREAKLRGFPVLRKPVRPAALRALLAALMEQRGDHSGADHSRAGAGMP